MKITIARSTRTKQEKGIQIDDQSVLFSPFHVWNPEMESDKAYQAYKAYLYQVIDKGLDPADIANTLAQKNNLKISLRWNPVTGDEVKREVQSLAQIAQTTSGLSLISNRDLGSEHGLKDYLEWKYPAPEQQSLLVPQCQ